jgi:hypothetical protein
MTSKEILAVIKGAFVSMNKDCEEAFNQIERDLEVLEQLQAIEEELGIDLITLFKAVKNRVYAKVNTAIIKACVGLSYDFDDTKKWALLGFSYGYEAEEWLYFEDYGKTWALTREELENDKRNKMLGKL